MKIIADSSYITACLLEDASLLEKDELLLSPDIAFYEVIHAIWKHQVLLKRIVDAKRHVDSFMQLIDSSKIQLIKPDSKIVYQAYDLAVEKNAGFYDAVFVALARELAAELKTFDKSQARLLAEIKRA